ncbi:hypothetical protein IVA95_34380 [Bradyrhizobium sp. 157]|uniref:hypothetical protein n=1 Tax=Bradyrhizobium sp. 157 TaxID=2782631 RepID=UPI001FFAF9CB|nr:hypothetical protein [Bradyrhizobium sp. 157]MCK1642503.1 hypothetical protein [Bradyrhizobium sp. 157]
MKNYKGRPAKRLAASFTAARSSWSISEHGAIIMIDKPGDPPAIQRSFQAPALPLIREAKLWVTWALA